MARRSISLAVAVTVFAVVTLASTAPAAACNCASFSDQDALDNADVVFRGELVEIRTPPGDAYSSADPERFVFDVDRVYKGDARAQQSVVTAREGASCGLELSGSGPFLVFARTEVEFGLDGEEGELFSNLCSGSRALDGVAVPDFLGPGEPAVAGASAIGSPDEGDSPVVPIVVGVAVVLALAGGFRVLRRARRN